MPKHRRNPLSRGRSYFPPWSEGLAYHAITQGRSCTYAELSFMDVWESGAIFSSAERVDGRSGGGIMDLDRLSGDDHYVFLSVSNPLSFVQDKGYYFAYDAEGLVGSGAQVGIGDLLETYQDALSYSSTFEAVRQWQDRPIAEWPPQMAETFYDRVAALQGVLRLSGSRAKRWVDWLFQGDAVDEPANIRDAAENFLNESSWLKYTEFHVPYDIKTARRVSELLVRDRLPLNRSWGLEGVAFRHIYFGIVDFNRLFKTSPGKPLPSRLGDVYRSMGYPYRCPKCRKPMVEGSTAREVLEQNPWVKIELEVSGGLLPAVPCESCQKFLVLIPTDGLDPHEVAEGDLFVPFSDVLYSAPFEPARCS